MKKITLLIISLILSAGLFAQVITKPNFALATHPIVVDDISFSDSLITITLTIQNKIKGGEFCANEIIYLLELKNKSKAYMLKSAGIPSCPETYKFEAPGEKLTFQLEFTAFDEIPKYINIVEDCEDNCFSIYGVIIDEKMNEDINQAFGYFKSGNLDFALASFRTAARENPGYPFAFLYGNIIEIYAMQENYEKAKQWYKFLKASTFVDKENVMEQISRKDFYDQLSD
jgi:tetratricopeptide (TPR) repeat protein